MAWQCSIFSNGRISDPTQGCCVGSNISDYFTNVGPWFPLGLEIRENLEKWEGIFQSGNFVKTGKVREFCPKYWKNRKIRIKNMFLVKVREFYTKCWKISGFEKITVSRSYLILFFKFHGTFSFKILLYFLCFRALST